jgi:hypothetical protein
MSDLGVQAEQATRRGEIVGTVVLSALLGVTFGLFYGKATLMLFDGPWGGGWVGLLVIVATLGVAAWEVVARTRSLLP